MLRILLTLVFCFGSFYNTTTFAYQISLEKQLEDLSFIEKGFTNMLFQKYDDAIWSFNRARESTSADSYFSETKHKLITIGQLIIDSIRSDRDILDVFSASFESSCPPYKEYLLLDGHIISLCIAIELEQDIHRILASIETDYNNPDLLRFDYGVNRIRNWIIQKLRPLIKEFYAESP